MSQSLDHSTWLSIRFEETELPQSLMGISILIVIDDFTEKTGDWIWALPHCWGMRKSGPASWCRESAEEIADYLIGNREEALAMIAERLGPCGFDPELTFAEWMDSLMKIREIASVMEDDCQWSAEVPGFDPQPGLDKFRRFLDSHAPEND